MLYPNGRFFKAGSYKFPYLFTKKHSAADERAKARKIKLATSEAAAGLEPHLDLYLV
jgi:hypothetical protein